MPDVFVVCLNLDNECAKNFVECQRKMWHIYVDIPEHALELDPVAWCQQYFQWSVWQYGDFSSGGGQRGGPRAVRDLQIFTWDCIGMYYQQTRLIFLSLSLFLVCKGL